MDNKVPTFEQVMEEKLQEEIAAAYQAHHELGRDKAVMDIIYTGPAPHFENLTNAQQLLFHLEQFDDDNVYAVTGTIYDRFAHKSFLATPRIITVIRNEKEMHQFMVADPLTSWNAIGEYLANFPQVITYGGEDEREKFSAYMFAKGLGMRTAVVFAGTYVTLEQHMAIAELDYCVECLITPHVFWREHTPRLLEAGIQRAKALFHMVNHKPYAG